MSKRAHLLITCTLCGILHSAPSFEVNNPVCPECRARRAKRARAPKAARWRVGSRQR